MLEMCLEGSMPVLRLKSTAQLKSFYTNTDNMGNEQEEMETTVQQESYDVAAIVESWWDELHDWSDVMDGYNLFRRNTRGRRGDGMALYIMECFNYTELKDTLRAYG
ncbi:mitochondrial fission process protein 1 [Willisornis vidua]|uniref:Mitochondrial fission process protein 1 n=1 Tax=Willisornis vidua TaxID=1566151 RepID=A0ABQ9CR55_9PASS|nr:mitochondrial fission process protein 1 [Willisornis vidua]